MKEYAAIELTKHRLDKTLAMSAAETLKRGEDSVQNEAISADGDKQVKKLHKDSENLGRTSCRTFTKTVLKQGQGFLRPYMESVCVVDIFYKTGEHAEIMGINECLQIPVGKNLELTMGSAEKEMMRTVEKCIMTMRKDEQSEFVIKFMIGQQMNDELKMLNSSVTLVVILHSFSETKPIWSLESHEKHQLALLHKERGTNLFKDGAFEAAFCQYSVAVTYLICIRECSLVSDKNLDPEQKSRIKIYNSLKCICYLNLAACQMKVKNHVGVINNCTHALSLDVSNVKGLYRRAQAYLACGKFDEAR